jgi:hypothetical protein
MVSLVIRKHVLNQLDKVHHERELALRIEQGDALYQLRVYPQRADEPVFVRFPGRAGVETSSQVVVGAAEIVVTRFRLILLVKSGRNARGLSQESGEVAIVSVNRLDLGSPQRVTTRSGKIKIVNFPGSDSSFVILVPHLRDFEGFLKVMAPEYAERLGHERAAEIADKRLDDELEAMLLEYEGEAADAPEANQKQTVTNDDRRNSPGMAAGLKIINRLMSSIPGRFSIVAACAFVGTVLILSGNYVQSYYAAEQARCSKMLTQPASCFFGGVATAIGSGLSKTGWIALFSPIVIVITAVIIVRRRA